MEYYIGKMLLEFCLNFYLKMMREKSCMNCMMENVEDTSTGRPQQKKFLRSGYYWPTLFPDTQNLVMSCHKCQIFDGKRKLLPLPLHPIRVEAPFQQWGLDFIGEIHPSSSAQHKWILTATDFFTKWIEAIPYRNSNDSVIIKFLETNILSRFGCPRKIITNNVVAFKSKNTVDFC